MATRYADFGNPYLGRPASTTPDGSQLNPYNTVAAIQSALAAGDDVLLRRSSVLRFGSGAANSGTVAYTTTMALLESRATKQVLLGYYGDDLAPPQFDSMIYDAPQSTGWALDAPGTNRWSKQITGLNDTGTPFTWANVQCGDDKAKAYQLRMRDSAASCTSEDDVYCNGVASPYVTVTINTGSDTVSPSYKYNGLAWSTPIGNGYNALFVRRTSNLLMDGIETIGGTLFIGADGIVKDTNVIVKNASARLFGSHGIYLSTFSNSLLFSAPLLAGATGGTLAVPWTGAGGVYQLFFGTSQYRQVTMVNGGSSITWSPALTANSTYGSYALQFLESAIAQGYELHEPTLYSGQRPYAAPQNTATPFGSHNGIAITGMYSGVNVRNPTIYGGTRHGNLVVFSFKSTSWSKMYPENTHIYGSSRIARSLIECIPGEYSRALGISVDGGCTVANLEIVNQTTQSQIAGAVVIDNLYMHDFHREYNPSTGTNDNTGADNAFAVGGYTGSDALWPYSMVSVTIKNCVIDNPTNYVLTSSTYPVDNAGGAHFQFLNNVVIDTLGLPKTIPGDAFYPGPNVPMLMYAWGSNISVVNVYRNNVYVSNTDKVYAVKDTATPRVFSLYTANQNIPGAEIQPAGNTWALTLALAGVALDFRPYTGSPAINAGVFMGYDFDASGFQRWNPPSAGAYEYVRQRA